MIAERQWLVFSSVSRPIEKEPQPEGGHVELCPHQQPRRILI